jgi:hypothetical protein
MKSLLSTLITLSEGYKQVLEEFRGEIKTGEDLLI